MMMNPIALIIAGIVGLIAMLVVLYKKCEWFRNIVNSIFKFISVLVKTFVAYFKAYINIVVNVIKGIVNVFKAVINFVKNNWKMLLGFLVNPIGTAFVLLYKKCTWFRNIVNGFVKGIKNAFLSMVNFIKSIPNKVKSVFTGMVNIGKNMVKGLVNGVKNAKQMAINSVKNLGSSIIKGIKKILGIKSPSKEFAVIGRFSVLGYEEGLEKMKPKLDKAINGMFSLSPSMTGTMNNTLSPNVNVVNNVNVETDPLGQVVSKIKTFSGGAKNDYNYGYGG
jgi:phage-related protein